MIDLLIDKLHFKPLKKTYRRRYVDPQSNFVLNRLEEKYNRTILS